MPQCCWLLPEEKEEEPLLLPPSISAPPPPERKQFWMCLLRSQQNFPRIFRHKSFTRMCSSWITTKTITALRAVTVYQVSKPKTKKDLHNDHSGSLGAVTVYQVKNPLFKELLNMCIPNRALSLRSDCHTRFQNEPGKRREITPDNVNREIFYNE